MNRLRAVFRAGRVRRWHTNADLAHTDDRIDGHSGRMARIILALHPDPSVALLRAALTHDDGEHAVGDIAAPAKASDPVLAAYLERLERKAREAIWGDDPDLTDTERRWLKFADRLDAYHWADVHTSNALSEDGWPEAAQWLLDEVEALGVSL